MEDEDGACLPVFHGSSPSRGLLVPTPLHPTPSVAPETPKDARDAAEQSTVVSTRAKLPKDSSTAWSVAPTAKRQKRPEFPKSGIRLRERSSSVEPGSANEWKSAAQSFGDNEIFDADCHTINSSGAQPAEAPFDVAGQINFSLNRFFCFINSAPGESSPSITSPEPHSSLERHPSLAHTAHTT